MSGTNIVKWVLLGLAGVLLVALFIFNTNNKPENLHMQDYPWNQSMVVGSVEAPNKMVEYSDYFCEFCAYFNEQASSAKFNEEYIDSGKLSLETRIITVLSEMSPNTEQGAESAYCAADQGKFAEYSNHLVPRIKQDFFDKNIGTKSSGKPIEKLPLTYFEQSAKAVGMDNNKFVDCMTEQPHKEEIATSTRRAVNMGVRGLPTVVVNDYVASGSANGWQGFEMMLKAGGVETD